MLQEIIHFHVFGRTIPIYGYGLMLVIGFLCASNLAKRLARRAGVDGELFVNAALIALATGVIGARLSHILENLTEFTDTQRSAGENLWAMINLTSGGLTYYGGFLLAFPTVVAYLLWKKLPLRLSMDIVAPCVMVGLAFGRIGCFLNGCCYGAECDREHVPWAVSFPYHSPPYMEQKIAPPPGLVKHTPDGRARLADPEDLENDPALRAMAKGEHSRPVHPAQLYSALTAFLLAGITLTYFTLPHAAGRGFALMLMLEGTTRFLLEMLRVEPAVLGPLSLSMVLGVGLAALGVVLWVVFGQMGEDSVLRKPAVALAVR